MISLMKDAHDGMSDAFRQLLESKDYSIYYHAPTVIMVMGKTGSRLREIDCSLCAGEHDACRPRAWYRQLLDRVYGSCV
ncbi:MAG: hypothetical protein MZV70_30495 [Desulfobacterales bacterium]|nr:hypothetical protein [Desulfobacterales bacterium]